MSTTCPSCGQWPIAARLGLDLCVVCAGLLTPGKDFPEYPMEAQQPPPGEDRKQQREQREAAWRWAGWSPEDLGQEIARLVTQMAQSRDLTLAQLRERNERLEREIESLREQATERST